MTSRFRFSLLVLALPALSPGARASEWQGPFQLSTGEDRYYQPRVAVAGNFVHVIWRDAGASTLEYRRSDDAGLTWDPVKTLYMGTVHSPRIAVWDQDEVHVVWRGPDSSIMYARSVDAGETFEPARTLSTNETRGYDPDVATYGEYVYVAWVQNVPTDIVFCRSVDDGATFEPPKDQEGELQARPAESRARQGRSHRHL